MIDFAINRTLNSGNRGLSEHTRHSQQCDCSLFVAEHSYLLEMSFWTILLMENQHSLLLIKVNMMIERKFHRMKQLNSCDDRCRHANATASNKHHTDIPTNILKGPLSSEAASRFRSRFWTYILDIHTLYYWLWKGRLCPEARGGATRRCGLDRNHEHFRTFISVRRKARYCTYSGYNEREFEWTKTALATGGWAGPRAQLLNRLADPAVQLVGIGLCIQVECQTANHLRVMSFPRFRSTGHFLPECDTLTH